MAEILIIDDEAYIRDILSTRVRDLGHNAVSASTLEQGMVLLGQLIFDLVFLDVHLPDGSGLDAFPVIREMPDPPLVIIITAFGNAEGARLAISNGAWDYIAKPIYQEELKLRVQRAIDYRMEKRKTQPPFIPAAQGIVGKSQAFVKCLDQVAQSAKSSIAVLLQGESGTGKELLARLIHDHSSAKENQYVVVDCAAMPETLMESMLFGHRKGAFTGADQASDGLIAMADGGTLFLDEIGELPLSAQKRFLRVLQEKKYRPVGSSKELSSRFRLISATNRDLWAMVENGTFRSDLYHRIQAFVIRIPPLRDREGDIRELAVHYTGRLCHKHGLKHKVLLPETISILERYEWPGNVRELINVLERAVLTDPELELVYPLHLPETLRISDLEKDFDERSPEAKGTNPARGIPVMDENKKIIPFKAYRSLAAETMEENYFRCLMDISGADAGKAADLSGLSKNRIYHYIRKFHLQSS